MTFNKKDKLNKATSYNIFQIFYKHTIKQYEVQMIKVVGTRFHRIKFSLH